MTRPGCAMVSSISRKARALSSAWSAKPLIASLIFASHQGEEIDLGRGVLERKITFLFAALLCERCEHGLYKIAVRALQECIADRSAERMRMRTAHDKAVANRAIVEANGAARHSGL